MRCSAFVLNGPVNATLIWTLTSTLTFSVSVTYYHTAFTFTPLDEYDAHVPEFEHIVLHLLHVECAGDRVSARHLLHVSLQLADLVAHNLRVDDITAFRDGSVRSSGECHFKERLAFIQMTVNRKN